MWILISFQRPNGVVFSFEIPEEAKSQTIKHYTAKGFRYLIDGDPVKPVKRGRKPRSS